MKAICYLLGCTAFACAANVYAQTKLLFNSFPPPTHAMNQRVFPGWIKDIEAGTEGRVKIEVAPSNLAPPPGQLDLVQKGGADIAWQFTGLLVNRLTSSTMTQVPSPTATAVVMSRAAWRTHQKYFGPADEYKGVKLLTLFVFPPSHFFSLKEPLNSVDQLKAMKVLTTPGTDAKAWGNLTTGVVTSPVVRFFDFVSKGTVDAYTSMPIFDVVTLNLAKNTKYVIDFKDAKNATTFALVMNEKKWESLSPADRAVIEKHSGEAFAARMKGVDDITDEAIKKLAADGVQSLVAPDAVVAGIKQAFAGAEGEWLAEVGKRGVDGRAALEFYRAQVQSGAK